MKELKTARPGRKRECVWLCTHAHTHPHVHSQAVRGRLVYVVELHIVRVQPTTPSKHRAFTSAIRPLESPGTVDRFGDTVLSV